MTYWSLRRRSCPYLLFAKQMDYFHRALFLYLGLRDVVKRLVDTTGHIYVRSPTQTTEMRIMYKLSLQFDTRWHDINIARRCNKHKFCVNCRQCTLRSRDVTNFACVLDPTQLLISPLYQKVIQCYIQSVKQEWTWWTTPVVDTSFANFTCRSRRKFCVLTRRIFTLQILKQQMTSKSKDFSFLNWIDQQRLFQSCLILLFGRCRVLKQTAEITSIK